MRGRAADKVHRVKGAFLSLERFSEEALAAATSRWALSHKSIVVP
jgi:hypothetical protein